MVVQILLIKTFDWDDLRSCDDSNGNELTTLSGTDPTDTEIVLSGTLFVNLVSPYTMGVTDSGYYRSLALVQQDWSISILKQINVLSSIGVDLFFITVMAISESADTGNFEMSLLTQTADYITLKVVQILDTPQSTMSPTITEVSNSCLVEASFICVQLFVISFPSVVISCTQESPANFSGTYSFRFEAVCTNSSDDNSAACLTFLNDNNGANINLEVTTTFIDTECNSVSYQTQFDGTIAFYDDEDYSQIHDPNPANNYIIGQSRIYVQVTADFPMIKMEINMILLIYNLQMYGFVLLMMMLIYLLI